MTGRVPDGGSTAAGLPERQNVEMALRLAAIVASSSDAMISKGLGWIIATWNSAAATIFGYRREEVIRRPVSVLAAPGGKDETPLMLDQIRRGDRIGRDETVRRSNEGLEVTISLTVSPSRTASGWIGRDLGNCPRHHRAQTARSRVASLPDHRCRQGGKPRQTSDPPPLEPLVLTKPNGMDLGPDLPLDHRGTWRWAEIPSQPRWRDDLSLYAASRSKKRDQDDGDCAHRLPRG